MGRHTEEDGEVEELDVYEASNVATSLSLSTTGITYPLTTKNEPEVSWPDVIMSWISEGSMFAGIGPPQENDGSMVMGLIFTEKDC